MKYIKMLGLAAVAAAALMAFVGASTASATVLTGSAGKLGVGASLDFSLKSGTSALLVTTAGEELDKCSTSTVKGTISNAGGAAATVSGSINTLSWGSCTFPTVTTKLGNLEAHHITGTTNATLTASSEIGVTINTIFFGSCVYGVTAGTDLGVVTGGNPATFHANAVAEKLSGSAFACPATSKWTGTYVSTEPAGALHAEAS